MTSSLHGQFVWYELMTNDVEAAVEFYRKVVGWGAQDAGMPGMTYMLLTVEGVPVAGTMAIPPEARANGMKPAWMGHVAVDNVDSSAAEANRLGGKVHHGPADIPGVGRFAVLSDPQGAVFDIFKSATEGRFQPARTGVPGHAGWHELFTTDREQAFAFYAEMFGWTKDQAFDMGPMGVYQLFAAGGAVIGGMMTKPPQIPTSVWQYYFTVDGIDGAKARVEEAGGKVAMGPAQVPGGTWILQCFDRQGAAFGLLASQR